MGAAPDAVNGVVHSRTPRAVTDTIQQQEQRGRLAAGVWHRMTGLEAAYIAPSLCRGLVTRIAIRTLPLVTTAASAAISRMTMSWMEVEVERARRTGTGVNRGQ